MRVGGKRILRIPPSLAYGDRGARGVIPPGAHIEFDCEVVKMADNPIDEALSLLNWSKERQLGFVALIGLMAVAPVIDKALSNVKMPF